MLVNTERGASDPAASVAIQRRVAKPRRDPKPVARAEDGGSIQVPSVVGKDHQLAQDVMQAAGLYNLRERDATGAGRLLLYDRNWTVVRQSPRAGSSVNEDAVITLYSKKDFE